MNNLFALLYPDSTDLSITPQLLVLLLCAGGLYIGCGYFFSRLLPKTTTHNIAFAPKTISTDEVLLLALIVIIAIIVRLPGLNRSLDFDELYTTYHFIEANTFWDTISTYLVFNNHIAYSILGRVAQSVFGLEDWVVRFPAFLMGISGVAFIWYYGRAFYNVRLGLMAALILALVPIHVLWSKSARGYSALVLLPLVSSYFFLKIFHQPTRLNTIWFVIASTIGIYFHLYTVWVLVAQVLYLFYLFTREMFSDCQGKLVQRSSFHLLLWAFPAIGLISLILYLPVLKELLFELSNRGNSLAIDFFFPLKILNEFTGVNFTLLALGLLMLATVGLVVQFRTEPRYVIYPAIMFLVPLMIMWLMLRPYDLYPRFFAYFLPYFVLFLAQGILVLWRFCTEISQAYSRMVAQVLMICIVGMIAGHWLIQIWSIKVSTDYRMAMDYLMQDLSPGTWLCGFGSDTDIVKHYQDIEFVLPEVPENIELVPSGDEVRCFYHNVFWNSEKQKVLAEFLSQSSTAAEFGDVIIYKFVR